MMNRKNIFKALAAAMLMPAMLLTTACSSSDDDIVNNSENTVKKGYTLPVTINVTRQGDEAATRATFNTTTKKLEFSTGDKLFVKGGHSAAGYFAGTLDYDAVSGKFSGTVTTQNTYTGTADALFTAGGAEATLLPAGYESYGFLNISGSGYEAMVSPNFSNAFATTTKSAGVEQLSLEYAYEYSSGFALAPQCAILNFTITGLTANASADVVFNNSSSGTTITKSVTTDASGNATFAIGAGYGSNLNSCTLTVGGNAITLVSSSTPLSVGKIYNINRAVAPAARTLAEATAADIGKIAGADGNIYANATAASDAGTTAVAMIAYVGIETDHATYTHGLAIALSDESNSNWSTAKSNCEGKTAVTNAAWVLPSENQWKAMFKANGGSESDETGLQTAITNAGGAALNDATIDPGAYWSSTDKADDTDFARDMQIYYGVDFGNRNKSYTLCVRACLAF